MTGNVCGCVVWDAKRLFNLYRDGVVGERYSRTQGRGADKISYHVIAEVTGVCRQYGTSGSVN